MSVVLSLRSQKLLWWWGVVLAGLYFFALIACAHMFPPFVDPRLSADQIAQLYQTRTVGIRIGAVIGALTSGFLVPMMFAVAAQMDRHERGTAHIWSNLTRGAGAVMAVPLALPMICFGTAAFSPYRAPDATALMHEFGLLSLVTGTQFYTFAFIAIAVICLIPHSVPHSMFPRWFGYYTLLSWLLAEAGAVPYLTRTGPFAWNGLLAWWVPLVTYGIWNVMICVLLTKAINAQIAEAESSSAVPDMSSV